MSQRRNVKIMMSFIAMVLTVIHYALPSFSSEKTSKQDSKLYETRFSKDWKLDPRIEKSKIWRLEGRKTAAFVSVTELDIATDKKELNASVFGANKSGAIEVASLNDFTKTRAASLSKIGITDWQIQSAKNLKLNTRKVISFNSFELRGSYRGPSGLTLCYVERQIDLGKRILQIIGTDHKSEKTSCQWDEISSWMNQVVL